MFTLTTQDLQDGHEVGHISMSLAGLLCTSKVVKMEFSLGILWHLLSSFVGGENHHPSQVPHSQTGCQ